MNTQPAGETADRPVRETRWGGSVVGYSSVGLALGGLALISLLCTDRADSKEPVQVAIRPDASAAANLATATLAAADAPAGVFKGVVTFKGTPPAPRLVFGKGDTKENKKPEDTAVCAAADYFSDEFLVNEKAGNGVANVVIYIEKTPAGYTPPPVPEEPAVFDQKGCRFIPHILIVRCNQKMLIKSDDPVVHNTNITSLRNTGFNQTISVNNRDGVEYTFKKPEGRPVPVKCDLHTFMKAHHLPLEHPLAAVTDADGKFEIKGVPPGKHTFIVWHEMCGYLTKKLEVDIKADKPTEQTLSYSKEQFFKQ
jgi:hypothetical protein